MFTIDWLLSIWDLVASSEQLGGHGRVVIVNKSAEKSEESHEQKQMSHWPQQMGNSALLSWWETKVNTKYEEESSMQDIAEHHSEKEGERDDGEVGWVHFLICRNSVGVNDLLEGEREFIWVNQGWLRKTFNFVRAFFECQTSDTGIMEHLRNLFVKFERFGAPNQSLENHIIESEHIEVGINCLFS